MGGIDVCILLLNVLLVLDYLLCLHVVTLVPKNHFRFSEVEKSQQIHKRPATRTLDRLNFDAARFSSLTQSVKYQWNTNTHVSADKLLLQLWRMCKNNGVLKPQNVKTMYGSPFFFIKYDENTHKPQKCRIVTFSNRVQRKLTGFLWFFVFFNMTKI